MNKEQINEIQRWSTCNWVDFETLGSQAIMRVQMHSTLMFGVLYALSHKC